MDGVCCERFSKSAADAFLFDETPAVPDTERIVISVSCFHKFRAEIQLDALMLLCV